MDDVCVSLGSGANAQEVGAWMTENDVQYPEGYDLVESDGSRFDGHCVRAFFQGYREAVTYVFNTRPCYAAVLRAQEQCTTYTSDGLAVRLIGTQKSGVTYTTSCNSLINAFILSVASRGMHVRVIVAGDDGLACCRKGEGEELKRRIDAFADIVGHVFKSKVVDLDTAKFLSSYFGEICPFRLGDGYITTYQLTPEPCRFLAKFGFSLLPQRHPRTWLEQNAYAAACNFSAEPRLRDAFLRIKREGPYRSSHDQWSDTMLCVPEVRRVALARRYGVGSLDFFDGLDLAQCVIIEHLELTKMFLHAGY